MEHYICTGGCKGISEKPGTCQASDCTKHEQPLEYCGCHDDKHNGAFGADESAENESSTD